MTLSRRCVLRTERTDFGKEVRKRLEAHEVKLKRMETKQYAPRLDGVSNTITGVAKDNWLLCVRTE